MIVQATAVARRVQGAWRAVLLFGPSGAGKSDLALRCVQAGWRLVADDGCRVWTSGGRLWARAPQTIAGAVEARGLGIVEVARLDFAPVALAVLCQAEAPERLPEPEVVPVAGLKLPCLRLRALEASAFAKLSHALAGRPHSLGLRLRSAYLDPSRGPDAEPRRAAGA